ncbi:hypothetical protein QA640_37180 [Bradyrhizobium sp. CB82]|uniref:hypothetical protein n=1 Tax=Bradyrhizobium sp. CB82 TaxID=3039159 RepID=UPI0024B1CB84|nr:hypothetical protein [Bradyrhizobium sp. CB82]WFU39901.1 hypothetical protein QA640_37180 [Bradyrhizobium sp. CB82]
MSLTPVARAAWPRWQDRRAVMCRHLGVAAVDFRIVEARLDDGDLGVVRSNSAGTLPIASKVPTWPLIQSASPWVQVACA